VRHFFALQLLRCKKVFNSAYNRSIQIRAMPHGRARHVMGAAAWMCFGRWFPVPAFSWCRDSMPEISDDLKKG
jgi:hypothetical protein